MRVKSAAPSTPEFCGVNNSQMASVSDQRIAAAPKGSRKLIARNVLALLLLLIGSAATLAGQAITLVPTLTTYAGNGQTASSGDGGLATAAGINNPEGIAYDGFGNTYIADYFGNKIRLVDPAGVISTIFGTGTACTATGAGAVRRRWPGKIGYLQPADPDAV